MTDVDDTVDVSGDRVRMHVSRDHPALELTAEQAESLAEALQNGARDARGYRQAGWHFGDGGGQP